MASRDYILGDISIEEQIEFLTEQIAAPFDSGNNNYFKKLQKMVKSKSDLDAYCNKLFSAIEDIYPDVEFDFNTLDQHLDGVFSVSYKFFIKNIRKLLFIFLKQYIFNNKNRKTLISDYINIKLPNYPKEQFGKKEYYILVSKLSPIVKTIGSSNISLSKFIEYIERDDQCPIYINELKGYIDANVINDRGVVENIFDAFIKSDEYNGMMSKLEMEITETLILPYLKENGMDSVRYAPISPVDDTEDEDDDDDDKQNTKNMIEGED